MSFGFSAKLNKFVIDKGKFTKTLDDKATALLKGAAREWLRAVYVKVPVWTGEARGSLKFARGRSGPGAGQFLATFLNVAISIEPQEIREGKDAESGGRKARWTLGGHNGKYSFTFNEDVLHYIILDNHALGFGNPNFPRPWESFKAGEEAFNNHILLHKDRLAPKVSDFITFTQIKLKAP